MKKILLVIISIISILTASYLIGTGFRKDPNVILVDYSISEDGTQITFHTGSSSSIGYIRGFRDHGGGVKPHYLTFYCTFGGLNSSWGFQNTFTLELAPNDTEIYFNRSDGGYELVLVKDEATGQWHKPTKTNLNTISNFNIALTWGIFGQSSYDSKTGTLIKTTNTSTPKDYITTFYLSDAQKNELHNMILSMDIDSYPEKYDPYNAPNSEVKIVGSKPPSVLILHIQSDTIDKTIECSCVLAFDKHKGYNAEAQAFLSLCERLYEMIISSAEWQTLPEYEILYE